MSASLLLATRAAGARFRLLAAACAALAAAAVHGHGPADNPAGVFELDWHTPQIKATYATGVFNTMGLRVDNDPGRARVVSQDGQALLQGIALTFDIDDQLAFDIDRDVTARIELDTTHLDAFYIAYDRNGGPDGLKRIPVPPGSEGFREFEIELERARFANRGFSGTDFAIAGGIDMSDRLLTIRSLAFDLPEPDGANPEYGKIELVVTEAGSGQRIAAQAGLYDERGRMPLPGVMATELQVFDQHTRLVEIREELDDLSWPHANRYAMYMDGYYRASVPAGTYTLVISRGPEFETVKRQVEVSAGGTSSVQVDLEHSLDMPSRGWYSGDVHNHFSRVNSAANALHMAHARAQDLHMHWLNELGNSTDTHFTQYAWGKAGEYREQDYYLASAQEDPRTDYLGHVLALGQDRRVRRAADYLRYDLAAADIRAAGGITGIAHMDFAQFWQDVALALLVADGALDFVEVMQFNSLHTRDWYRFLNMGFRLPAAAGSDWPYMALPGSVRTYVKVDGEFTPEAWKNGLRSGRSFVSNGPMIDLTVKGQPIGARIAAEPGDVLEVRADAQIEPSRDLLQRLDLIVGGEVVASVEPEEPAERLQLAHSLAVDAGTWVAVRAHGVKAKDIFFQGDYTMRNIAHSSPIYVEVAGVSANPREAGELMGGVIERLEWFKGAAYARNDNEIWESPERTAELVALQREEIAIWVDRIAAWYANQHKQLAESTAAPAPTGKGQ